MIVFFVLLQPPRIRECLETRLAFEDPWSMHSLFMFLEIALIHKCPGTRFAFEALWSVYPFFVLLQPLRAHECLETRFAFEVAWSVHSGHHPCTLLWTRNNIRLRSIHAGRGYLTAVYCDNHHATMIIPLDHLLKSIWQTGESNGFSAITSHSRMHINRDFNAIHARKLHSDPTQNRKRTHLRKILFCQFYGLWNLVVILLPRADTSRVV